MTVSSAAKATTLTFYFNLARFLSCHSQGELATDHDVVDFIMNQPSVVPRINPRVLSTSRTYLDLSDTSKYEGFLNFKFFFRSSSETNVLSVTWMTSKLHVEAQLVFQIFFNHYCYYLFLFI